MDAAIALSKSLSLPSGRGSVYAWHDNSGCRLVISADESWVSMHRSLPQTFQGYAVIVEEQFNALAHRRG
jgi:hypothetical protein